MLPEVFVLGRHKGGNYTTQVLTDCLLEAGVPAYAVTPHATPRFKRERVKLLVNDGVSEYPDWLTPDISCAVWLNRPSTVGVSANKIHTFRELDEGNVETVRWTQDRETAASWGKPVVVRRRIAGARGQGIEIVQPEEVLPEARLYTELFTGKFVKEYRVFVVAGKVVDTIMRMRKTRAHLIEMGIDPDDEHGKLVRCHQYGWVFARNSWERRENELAIVHDLAERAAAAIDLGYGAVDIAVRRWKDRDPDAVVIETNTHIGFEGSTGPILARAIKEVYDEVA